MSIPNAASPRPFQCRRTPIRPFWFHALATIVLAASALATVPRDARADDPITVFAAASLTDAMTAATDAFTAATGIPVRLSFASSSTLARQIEAGAPADLFASANESWMDYLAERGMIDLGSRVSPLANTLVLVAPTEGSAASVAAPAEAPDGLPPGTALADLLESVLGANGRLAVGDPDHVPAGLYARQALETLGLWSAMEGRLARADNVRAALALVARGEAPAGIVYATDAAIADGVAIVARFPADSTGPITYPFALLPDAGPAAADLLSFLTGPTAGAIFAEFGFTAAADPA